MAFRIFIEVLPDEWWPPGAAPPAPILDAPFANDIRKGATV